MQKRKCEINACSGSNRYLFHSPSNQGILQQWKTIIQTDKEEFYLCERHFEDKFIEKSLHSRAIPTVLIPDSTNGEGPCICCQHTMCADEERFLISDEIKRKLHNVLQLQAPIVGHICYKCNEHLTTFDQFKQIVLESFNHEYIVKNEPTKLESEIEEIYVVRPTNDTFDMLGIKEESIENEIRTALLENLKVEPPEMLAQSITYLECGLETEADKLSENSVMHNQPYVCDLCDRSFNHRKSIERHIQRHIKSQQAICIHCKKSFLNQKTLISHLNRYHSRGNKYVCDHCHTVYSSRKEMVRCRERNYVRAKPSNQMEKCVVCQKEMKSSSIRMHILSVHERQKNFTCITCGQAYFNNFSLQVHMRSHSGEKPICCDQCGKFFRDRKSLNSHVRINHSAREQLPCSICSKLFLSKFKLNEHVRKFHPNGKDYGIKVSPETNKYHCPNCSMQFYKLIQYENHLKRDICKFVSNDGFQCKTCNIKLSSMKGLSKHIKHVHAATKSRCHECGKELKNAQTLWQHITLSHKGKGIKKRKSLLNDIT